MSPTEQAATADAVSCEAQRITVVSNPTSSFTSSLKLPTTVPGSERGVKIFLSIPNFSRISSSLSNVFVLTSPPVVERVY